MQALYDWLVSVQGWFACWLVNASSDVAAGMPGSVAPYVVDFSTSISYVAIFMDTAVFPAHFAFSLGVLLASIVIIWIVRLVRLIIEIIPFV